MQPGHSKARHMLGIVAAVTASLVLYGSPVSAASGPYLVKDIKAGSASSRLTSLTAMDGMLYFAAKGGGRGMELWMSDGSAAGTRRVKDIRPGVHGSLPDQLTPLNGLLYFVANDGTHGRELWVSDGTGAGTRMVKDINPGWGSSDPDHLAAGNGLLYFDVWGNVDGKYADQLWVSDGTGAGTRMVKPIDPSRGNDWIAFTGDIVPMGGKAFFLVYEAVPAVSILYQTNGTAAGTKPLRDRDGHKIKAGFVTSVGSTLYFSRYRNGDWELWKSRGSAATTARIADVWIARDDPVTGIGTTAVFAHHEMSTERNTGQLWRSDGTPATTLLVEDFTDAAPGVVLFTAVNGRLFFDVGGFFDLGTINQTALWVSDGSGLGTQQLNVPDPVFPQGPAAAVGGVLYFAGTSQSRHDACCTLWRSDGTTAGTYSLGGAEARMHDMTAVGDGLFWASNAEGHGYELWGYVP